MVDQDTAPKELFYTEGPDALRAARLQVATPRCPAHPVSPGRRWLRSLAASITTQTLVAGLQV